MMLVNRAALAMTLADMPAEEIHQLRHDELVRREQEAARKAAGRLEDPPGTVRYDQENKLFLVCEVDEEDPGLRYWTAYFPERHETVPDEDINRHECPVLGRIVDVS